MEYYVADSYKDYKRIGKPFDKNGRMYTIVECSCDRCGGSGIYKWGAVINERPQYAGTCLKCMGTGKLTKEVRLYTEKEYTTMQNRKEKTRVKKEEAAATRRKEARANAQTKWYERNGFSNGYTYLIYGNTFPIKDMLKERGCKFSKDLKWHSAEEIEVPSDCGVERVDFDSLYEWGTFLYEPKFIGEEVVEEIFQKTFTASEFVGEIKERLRNLECTLKEKKFLENYGCYCYGFDYNGNCLSWVTEKDLEFEEGDVVTLTGTVKSHKVFAGNKTTYLNRCIVKQI